MRAAVVVVALLVGTAAVSAAPPQSCVSKFTGSWEWTGGNTTSDVFFQPNGAVVCSTCSNMTWTCNGNSLVLLLGAKKSSIMTLSDDEHLMTGINLFATSAPQIAVRKDAFDPDTKQPPAKQQPSEQLLLGDGQVCQSFSTQAATNPAQVIAACQTWAKQGNAKGYTFLGMIYKYGMGVPRNDHEAVKWLRKAAELGDADGQNSLGNMYAQGMGVKKDLVQAYMWFILSEAGGNTQASTGREATAANMTPAQIAKAKRLASASEAKTTAPAPAQPISNLPRFLQQELKRLGCYSGSLDGNWGPASRKALLAFAQQAQLDVGSQAPNEDLLRILKSKPGAVCVAKPAQQSSPGAGTGAAGCFDVSITVDAHFPSGGTWDMVGGKAGNPDPKITETTTGATSKCDDTFSCSLRVSPAGQTMSFVILDRDFNAPDPVGSGTCVAGKSCRLGSASLSMSRC